MSHLSSSIDHLSYHIDHKSLCDIYYAIDKTTDGWIFIGKINYLMSRLCIPSDSSMTSYYNDIETQYIKYQSDINRIWFQFYSSEILYAILEKIKLIKYYNGFDLIYLFHIMGEIKLKGIDSYLSKSKYLIQSRKYESARTCECSSCNIQDISIILGNFKKYSECWSKIFFIINVLPGIDTIGFNQFINFYQHITTEFFCDCTECNTYAEHIFVEWAKTVSDVSDVDDKIKIIHFNPKHVLSNFPINHSSFSSEIFNIISRTIIV
jgi:hypothetical protein